IGRVRSNPRPPGPISTAAAPTPESCTRGMPPCASSPIVVGAGAVIGDPPSTISTLSDDRRHSAWLPAHLAYIVGGMILAVAQVIGVRCHAWTVIPLAVHGDPSRSRYRWPGSCIGVRTRSHPARMMFGAFLFQR